MKATPEAAGAPHPIHKGKAALTIVTVVVLVVLIVALVFFYYKYKRDKAFSEYYGAQVASQNNEISKQVNAEATPLTEADQKSMAGMLQKNDGSLSEEESQRISGRLHEISVEQRQEAYQEYKKQN